MEIEELTDEVKMIKKYVNGYMNETLGLKNELSFRINKKIEELTDEVNKKIIFLERINEYLLTRLYVIVAVLFFMFVMIMMK